MQAGFERTLIIIKPDAVARRLSGRIINRLEEKGLFICAMKMLTFTKTTAGKHYAEHKGKPFYKGLIEFITSGPSMALVVEGVEAINVCRKLVGSTCGREAAPGTIRGDYGMSNRHNLVHASDCPKSAKREIRNIFKPGEIVQTPTTDLSVIYNISGPKPL